MGQYVDLVQSNY